MSDQLSDNERITRWMGHKKNSDGLYYIPEMSLGRNSSLFREDQILYDASWDWLMPVVQNIHRLWYENVDQYNTVPKHQRDWDNNGSRVIMLSITVSIQIAYKEVVEFIKWHESQETNKV